MEGIVLEVFPGVGLLGRAFEEEGFCVVRGPDLIFGGDVRRFHPKRGAFWGVIGGPPCQDFSQLRRDEPTGYGLEMLAEFRRVIEEAAPAWWLMENVARVPSVRIRGYSHQRTDVDQGWFCAVSRLRHIQFGSRDGRTIDIPRGAMRPDAEPCALASDARSVETLKRLQGLPTEFDLPGFTVEAQKRAIGNGVPLVMGRVLARCVQAAFNGGEVEQLQGPAIPRRACACGCGRLITDRQTYAHFACRKRAQRQRDAAAVRSVTRRPAAA